jgi:hypothetical protein
VTNHLEASKAVVAVQLLGDVEDDGFGAVVHFLAYFVEHCGGLVQADGEGFYDGDDLLVALD